MNRAERRRAGRTGKTKTYVLTEDQIQQMKNEAVAEAVKMLLAIPMLVLHDKFGYGQIRLDRFLHYSMGWVRGIQNGEVSITEVVRLCEKETGLKIKEK